MNWNGGARSRFQPGAGNRGQFRRTYQLDNQRGGGDNAVYGLTEHVVNKRPCPLLDFIKSGMPDGNVLALQLSHQMELDVERVPAEGEGDAPSSGQSSPQSGQPFSWSQGQVSTIPDNESRSHGLELNVSRGSTSSFFDGERHTSGRASRNSAYGAQGLMDTSVEDEGRLADEILGAVATSPNMWDTPPPPQSSQNPNQNQRQKEMQWTNTI